VNPASTRVPFNKEGCRSEFKARLIGALQGGAKAEWDQIIATQVRDLLPAQGGLVAAFQARADEPGIVNLLARHDPQWRWAFPRVEGRELAFYLPATPMSLKAGTYGLLEPDPAQAEAVRLEHCPVAIVPGVAFDRSGTRLGRGQGFYDRALLNFSGLKIGVCYSVQLANENFTREPHDVPVDIVVTEKSLLRLKG
jgi:5-formyltetrahydrofolate cyclo-ligase